MPLSAVAARKARAAALAAAAAAAAAAASAASAASSSDNAPHAGPSASASGSSSEKEAAAARPSKRQKRLDSTGGGSSDNDESSGTEVGDEDEDDDVQKAERLARAELEAVGHRAGRNGGGIAGSKSLRYFVGGAVSKSGSAANTEEDDDNAESDDDEEPPESQAASDDGAEDEEEGGGAGGLESARQESSRGVGRRAQQKHQQQLTGANTTALHVRQQPGSARAVAASAAEAHRPLTTWRPRFGGASKNCIPVQSASKEQGAVLALGANETLCFVGIARVEVLHGALQISTGTTLRAPDAASPSPAPSSALLFAPSSSALPILRAPAAPSSVSANAAASAHSTGLDTSLFNAVIRLTPHESSGIQYIGRGCPVAGGDPFTLSSPTSASSSSSAAEGHASSDPGQGLVSAAARHFAQIGLGELVTFVEAETRALRGQADLPAWSAILDHIEQDAVAAFSGNSAPAQTDAASPLAAEAPIVLVRGMKRTGKSTFARRCLQRLLCAQVESTTESGYDRVAFLDLDLGQSEFSPPGMLSLHIFQRGQQGGADETSILGPSWCTLRAPLRAHFVGDTSPSDAPREYMDAVYDLIDAYRRLLAGTQGSGGASAAESEQPAAGETEQAAPTTTQRRRPPRAPRAEAVVEPASTASANRASPGTSTSRQTAFIPLVVNTMGWVKGLGADLLAQIERKLDATHIVDFQSALSKDVDADAALHASSAIVQPYQVPRQQQGAPASTTAAAARTSKRPFAQVFSSPAYVAATSSGKGRLAAADMRTLSLMSYLHAAHVPNIHLPSIEQRGSLPTWDFGKPLISFDSLAVDMHTGLPGGIHVLPFGAAVDEADKLDALNASIAAIVVVEEPQPASEHAPLVHEQPRGRRRDAKLGPHHQSSHCLGLAIVRAIDRAAHKLHLLTPLTLSEISSALAQPATDGAPSGGTKRTLALLKGAIQVPVWAFLDFELVQAARDGSLPHMRGHLLGGGTTKIEDAPYIQLPPVPPAPASASATATAPGTPSAGQSDAQQMHMMGGEMAGPYGGSLAASGEAAEDGFIALSLPQQVPVLGAKKRSTRKNVMRRSQRPHM